MKRTQKAPRIGETPIVVYPRGLHKMLGISPATRWRMEADGRLPPRDFFIGADSAVGWHPETLQRAFRGPSARRRRR